MHFNAYNNIPNLRFCLWFSMGFLVSEDSRLSLSCGRAQSSSGKDIRETGAILNHGSHGDISQTRFGPLIFYVCVHQTPYV